MDIIFSVNQPDKNNLRLLLSADSFALCADDYRMASNLLCGLIAKKWQAPHPGKELIQDWLDDGNKEKPDKLYIPGLIKEFASWKEVVDYLVTALNIKAEIVSTEDARLASAFSALDEIPAEKLLKFRKNFCNNSQLPLWD